MKIVKPKISNVTRRDVEHSLPDLHYTAIATIPALDAVLLCLGLLDIYESTIALPSRRNGQKLYVRASANCTQKQFFDFQSQDAELAAELCRRACVLSALQLSPSNAKVTFKTCESDCGRIVLPLDCVIGSIVPRTIGKNLREWHIASPTLLNTFYPVPSRGGIFFARQVAETLNGKEQINGNL